MNKSEILSKVTEVVRDQLDSDDVVLRNDTISSEVEGWDSLAHVRIMIAIEQSMGVRFKTTQITSIENVGQLVDLIHELKRT